MTKKYLLSVLFGLLFIWFISPSVRILAGRLRADINIYRDALGIARVTAHNLPDLFYATGAALARDRLWSLYCLKQSIQGRSSSIYGPSALPIDKYIRSLNITERVKGQITD